MAELTIVPDPRHQVCVLTGFVDMKTIHYGAGRHPWPWMIRGLQTKTSMLDANGTPALQTTAVRLLVQGAMACEGAKALLSDGDLVTIRGSLVELAGPTGGNFSGIGILVGSIYPIMREVGRP